MSFINQLEAIISKATDDYDKISKNEPLVESSEDGTARGNVLDVIIKQQNAEKKKLWNKLYKLEKERIKKGKNKVFQEKPSTANEKRLLTAMHESYELEKEVKKQQDDLGNVVKSDDKVLEIQFREQLDREITEYDQTIHFLKTEIEKAKFTVGEEKMSLSECQEVYESLKARKETLMETNPEVIANKMEEHLGAIQSMLKQDTRDLINFLDEYYPPHPINENEPLGEDCDLKKILEHLMNLSYTMPDSPYVPLAPGTYWKPYIETLAKAGIIRYHPEDANQICLEDFKI
ncbi:hypothetical protein G6F37_003491 [Rhizopus arrhizus]|nr:hypothetical protein G6F38_003439 [Rhizopus arrhizus]KAG1160981.1 hypothetical protein G6F37_003491 [Rhizopus arrhizus]